MNVKTRIGIEKKIYTKIIEDALNMGYSVTILDDTSNEAIIDKSTDNHEILNGMFSMDEDNLEFYDSNNNYLGFVYLVYGNDGWDVICDYSDNKVINDVLDGAFKLADTLEKEYT